jgi:hypothetical protein
LGCIYLQLARAIADNRQSRRCAICQIPFELGGETSRSDRKFCSSSCRTQHHRDKQTRAVELHKDGMTPGKIAKALESDLPTIKKWLALAKEQQRGT